MCGLCVCIPTCSSLLHTTLTHHTTATPVISVDRDGTILEKPDDAEHAVAMIRSLQGRQHLVHSGVAVFSSKHPSSSGAGAGGEAGLVPVARFCETARVTFCPLTEEEIWSYVRCVFGGVGWGHVCALWFRWD